MGSKERETEEDQKLVEQLIEKIAAKHFEVLFICTNSWTRGVGQFVRAKCTQKDGNGVFLHQLIIFDIRTYAQYLSRDQMAEIYISRNAAIFELADMLYYFADRKRMGTFDDLCKRMQEAGRPTRIFMPGEPVTLIGDKS